MNTDNRKHCCPRVGQHVEGIWHTAIVAYGREYFFGPSGIQTARPVSISLYNHRIIYKGKRKEKKDVLKRLEATIVNKTIIN